MQKQTLVFSLGLAIGVFGCAGSEGDGDEETGQESEGEVIGPVEGDESEAEAEGEGDDPGNGAVPNVGEECSCADEDKGTFCVESTETPTCKDGAGCLRLAAAVGVCTISDCRLDDANTPAPEDDCESNFGTNFVCVGLPGGEDDDDENTSLSDNFCLKRCDPSDGACSGSIACDPFWAVMFSVPFPDSVCFAPKCQSDADCGVDTGVECQLDPAPAQSECGEGLACGFDALNGEGPNWGADDAVLGGFCMAAGRCDTETGLCTGHAQGSATARIGDPCMASTDCPNDSNCLREALNDDGTVNFLRNGYCTRWLCAYGDPFGCQEGSGCNRIYGGGFCQRTCDPADGSTCRGNEYDACTNAGGDFAGDYECYDWGGTFNCGDVGACSEGPVCDWSSRGGLNCDFMANGIGAPCNSFGESYDCIDFASGQASAEDDSAEGWCSDASLSGPAISSETNCEEGEDTP